MEDWKKKISDRFLDYGVEIIKITIELNKNIIGKVIANQLLRSGTSAGANFEETYGAESKTDFIHKLQLVLKELKESLYWLRLITSSKIIKYVNLKSIINEAEELCKIFAQSVITAKNNR